MRRTVVAKRSVIFRRVFNRLRPVLGTAAYEHARYGRGRGITPTLPVGLDASVSSGQVAGGSVGIEGTYLTSTKYRLRRFPSVRLATYVSGPNTLGPVAHVCRRSAGPSRTCYGIPRIERSGRPVDCSCCDTNGPIQPGEITRLVGSLPTSRSLSHSAIFALPCWRGFLGASPGPQFGP